MDWTGTRVLVTGAMGFIGRRLVGRLVQAGARVYAGAAPEEPAERIAGLPDQAERLIFDLRDGAAVQAAVAEVVPEVVLHLAAVGVANPDVDPALVLAVNAGGVVNVLAALREREVGRVVLTGTCYEYGAAPDGRFDPFNAYAASKVAAWAFGRMYWRKHGLPVVTVRPFQVYGPGQPACTLVPAAIQAALAGKDFAMTPGEQARDFVYIDEAVAMTLFVLENRSTNGIFNAGTGRVHTFNELAEALFEGIAKEPVVEYFPMPEEIRNRYQYYTRADMGRLSRAGYQAGDDRFKENVVRYVRDYLLPGNKYLTEV